MQKTEPGADYHGVGLPPVKSPATPAAEARAFAFAVGGALVVIASFLWLRGLARAPMVLGATGALLLLGGILIPAQLTPLARGWAAFGLLLSRFTTPLVLGIIYFLVITPIGLFRRALGRNALDRDRSADSFWVPVQKRADPRRALERQF
jgi:hypothetical protein